MKAGILGGTFDPVHMGHLRLAEAALTQYGLDKVLFVPASVPPHKTAKEDILPAPFRFRMVNMALKDHPEFELSEVELLRPGISYTVDTLRDLRKAHPQDEFFLILGADCAQDFQNWKEPQEIKKMARLLAARRPGSLIPENGMFQFIEMPEMDISSSAVRERLVRGETLGPELLPPDVMNYIRRMNLYQKTSGLHSSS